jgi:5-formyltetrahydrofolate cyclo-ligase
VADDKRVLRAEMRAVRARIAADPADRLARSSRIWAGIVSLGPLDGRRVMLFEGLPTEPATEAWFDWCRKHCVDVYAPEVDGPDLRVMPGDLDPQQLDVVVVPGLAFTLDGHRLGQGGGHYDRFLPLLRPDCMTIGACFTEQVVASVPTSDHDIQVDHVVSA